MNKICNDIQKYNNIKNKYERFPIKLNPIEYDCPAEIISDMNTLNHGIQYTSHLTSIFIISVYTIRLSQNCIQDSAQHNWFCYSLHCQISRRNSKSKTFLGRT